MAQEPLDLYDKLQPLVQQDIRAVVDEMLNEDKYNVSNTQAHTHNGTDAIQLQTSTALSDYKNYLAYTTITLTPAQVKALKTTPLTIVQAPVPANFGGASAVTPKSVIIVRGITGRLNYGGTAYTGANALEFRYTGAAGAKVTADISTTFLNASASAYVHVAGVTTELVPVANAPIVVCVPVADPGAGNSPITFTVHYTIVSFSA